MVNKPKPNQKRLLNKQVQPRKKRQNVKKKDTRQALAKEFRAVYRPTSQNAPSKPERKQFETMLSKCALKYALAIANPFNIAARGACIPTLPAPESFKTSGFIRGTAFIGTAGVGFICVSPCVASNMPALYVTNASYTGTSTLLISAINQLVPGISTLSVSNIPFQAANFTSITNASPNVLGRIVSAGLSVQYVGTLMNTSGVVYALRDPAHNSILSTGTGGVTGSSAQSLGLRAEASICPFTSEKCTVVDFPADMEECAYPGKASSAPQTLATLYPFCNANDVFPTTAATYSTLNVNGLPCGVPTSVILFTGVPGSAVQFEYMQHAEYVGPGAAALVTATESDLPGLSKVLGAAETIVERSNAQPDTTRWGLMRESLVEMAKAAAPVVLPMMESAAMALLV
jgi:hypothetical protein